MGDFCAEAFHLFRSLDALGHIGLAVVLEVQQLVVLLERRYLRFLCAEFGVELGDSGIYVIGCLLNDVPLLDDGVLVVDRDHFVKDVSSPFGGCVLEREIDNTVGSAVALDGHPAAVRCGYIIDIQVTYGNRVIVEQLPQGPCRVNGNAAKTGGDRISEMSRNRFEFSDCNCESGIFLYGYRDRCVFGISEIGELDIDRGKFVQILKPFHQFSLVLVCGSQIKTFGYFKHGSFRLEDYDFIVDGVHGSGHPAVGNVLQHGGAVVKPIPGNGTNHDFGVALVNAVGPVATVPSYGCAYCRTKEYPMQIAQYGIEYILPAERIGVFFLEEGQIVFLIGGHCRSEVYLLVLWYTMNVR